MGLLKPKCYFGILCPHCELPRLRAEPAQVLPFPNLFPPAKAVTTGTTTTNYTTAGSYNYTVPAYNNMTVTVNGCRWRWAGLLLEAMSFVRVRRAAVGVNPWLM